MAADPVAHARGAPHADQIGANRRQAAEILHAQRAGQRGEDSTGPARLGEREQLGLAEPVEEPSAVLDQGVQETSLGADGGGQPGRSRGRGAPARSEVGKAGDDELDSGGSAARAAKAGGSRGEGVSRSPSFT